MKYILFLFLFLLNNCSTNSDDVVLFENDNTMGININDNYIKINENDYFYYFDNNIDRDNINRIENFITINDKILWYIIGNLHIDSRKKEESTYKILNFIHLLKYISDGNIEHIKYPLETIIEGGGDCEDTSLLFVSLAKIIDLDVFLLQIPGHIMAVVNGNFYGYYLIYNNKKYYTVETTDKHTKIGNIYIHTKEINKLINKIHIEKTFNMYLIDNYQFVPIKIEKDK